MLEQADRSELSSPSEYTPCRPWTPPVKRPLPSLRSLVVRMSHDIRTPMAAVLANAEFLALSNRSQPERYELFEDIRLAIDQMNNLLAHLLDCAKGEEVLRPSMNNIVETTERVMRMIGIRPAFRRISITHRHEGTPVGWYNSQLLERALANLVLNACEAVPPDWGRVTITTLGGPSCLRIEVWDNGPGIPHEIRNSLFQPFVTYGKREGTGLGLAIAKRIIEDHGGELFLDTETSAGTAFTISMPFCMREGMLEKLPP